MNIRVGGWHGSFPVSGPAVAAGGGDTVALLVGSAEGGQVILDAGSGIWNLLPDIRPGAVLAMSHFHLDHLAGLPLLAPKRLECILSARAGARGILARVFSPPVWPVDPVLCPCKRWEGAFGHGGLAVSFHPVAHPDGCHAIRVDEPATGESLVLATDTEWGAMSPAERGAFAAFAQGAGDLYFDCGYLPEEIASHRGWGHSTWEEAVEAARMCGARALHPIHFAPACGDAQAGAIRQRAEAAFAAPERPGAEDG